MEPKNCRLELCETLWTVSTRNPAVTMATSFKTKQKGFVQMGHPTASVLPFPLCHAHLVSLFDLQIQKSNCPLFGVPRVQVVPAWGVFTGCYLRLLLISHRVNFLRNAEMGWRSSRGGVTRAWDRPKLCKCVSESTREREREWGGGYIYILRSWCSQTQLGCFTISHRYSSKKGEFDIFASLSISITTALSLCVIYYSVICS